MPPMALRAAALLDEIPGIWAFEYGVKVKEKADTKKAISFNDSFAVQGVKFDFRNLEFIRYAMS